MKARTVIGQCAECGNDVDVHDPTAAPRVREVHTVADRLYCYNCLGWSQQDQRIVEMAALRAAEAAQANGTKE